MKYEASATALLEELKGFSKNEFEVWFRRQVLFIGKSQFFGYITEFKKWNSKPVKKETAVTYSVELSEQVKLLLQYFPDVNIDDLKIWAVNDLAIGIDFIYAFIEFKRKEVK